MAPPIASVHAGDAGAPERVRALLADTGAVVVGGVDVASDPDLLDVVGWAGVPSAHGNGGGTIYDVAPRPDAERRDLSSTAERFPLHTDSTFMPVPHRFVALGCVSAPVDGGGESRVLDVEAVRGSLAGTQALEALGEPAYPFLVEDPAGGQTGRLLGILAGDGPPPAVRFRDDILVEVGRRGGVELAPRHRDALEALRGVLAEHERQAGFLLGPGDVLLVDNHRMLHGRTAIAAGARRLLRRVKADAIGRA